MKLIILGQSPRYIVTNSGVVCEFQTFLLAFLFIFNTYCLTNLDRQKLYNSMHTFLSIMVLKGAINVRNKEIMTLCRNLSIQAFLIQNKWVHSSQ